MALPHPPDPVLLHLGPLGVRWYGVLLALAAGAGYAVARLCVRKRIAADAFDRLAVLLVVVGFISARLYHVLNEPAFYWAHPSQIPAVWNGGLAIHGGLLGGALALVWWARRNRVATGWLFDAIAPAVAIGQAIGRFGNYINQELFGRPTQLPWALPVDPAFRPEGYEHFTAFHPTFLYESLGDLATFGLLLLLRRRWKTRRDGDLALVYLVATSVVRTGTELLRVDRVPHLMGMRLPLLVAALLALTAAAILTLRHVRPHPVH